MILVPVAVDVPMARWPWMNWAMMAAIFLCYSIEWTRPEIMETFVLGIDGKPAGVVFDESHHHSAAWFQTYDGPTVDESPLSWIGHMFLHADIFHILGNLIFMWVFGNAVCAKVGNGWYPLLWLGCGLVAAVGQRILDPQGALLGASGAIAGIMGFYIVFYLLNDVTMFYFIWLIRFHTDTFSLSSFWVVGAYTALDIYGAVSGGGGVAYFAHLGGTAAGFAAATILLKTGLVEADEDERTLFDAIAARAARKDPSKAAAKGVKSSHLDPPPDRMLRPQTRLHVRLPNGTVKHLSVEEFDRHEAQGKPVDQFPVSEDGKTWTTYGQWRQRRKK